MTEHDKQIVEAAKAWVDKYYSNKVPGENIAALVEIVKHLDKQLTEITGCLAQALGKVNG